MPATSYSSAMSAALQRLQVRTDVGYALVMTPGVRA
jgi:hypothetical protein